jgi:hypothetical protein
MFHVRGCIPTWKVLMYGLAMGIREEMQIAGIANTKGTLGNQIPPGRIPVPGQIELLASRGEDGVCHEDIVHWTLLGDSRPQFTLPKFIPPPPDLLQAFIDLCEASGPDIREFIRRYGALGLAKDGSFPKNPNFVEGFEPIARWHSMARETTAILKIAAALDKRQQAGAKDAEAGEMSPEEIRAMGVFELQKEPEEGGIYPGCEPSPTGWYWGRLPFPKDRKEVEEIARKCMDQRLEDYLYEFPSQLAFKRAPRSGGIELEIRHTWGLPSVIALQLVAAVAKKGIYFCAQCKQPFVRAGGSNEERKPRSGSNTFCDRCGRSASVRLADERRRGKIRMARQLSEKGISIPAIQKQLDVRDVKTIRRWIQKGK